MAFIMLTAIVFRSLPDSVFDYFHSHTHVNRLDSASSEGAHYENYSHNCHIAEWNYIAAEVTHSIQLTSTLTGTNQNPPVHLSEYLVSSIISSGRAPPVV